MREKCQIELDQLRDSVHRRVLNLRAIETILSGEKFQQLWEKSDKILRLKVIEYIEERKVNKVRQWMRLHPSVPIQFQSHASLKEIAKKYQITNYSRKDKGTLIREIQEVERRLDEIEKRIH